MRLHLTHLDNERGVIQFSICFPVLWMAKKIKADVGDNKSISKLELNTLFSIQSNNTMIELEFLVLGFGIRLYMKEKV